MTYRIGLIGAGDITAAHAPGWLASRDRATVVGVADVDRDAATRLASVFDARTFDDFRQMIATCRPDAVDVCVPPHLHVDVVSEAAAQGVHVLCEKPIARDLNEADQIGVAVRRSGITYLPAHNSLFYPTVRRAREYLERGDLGDPFLFRSWDCDTDLSPTRFGHSLQSTDRAGETWRSSRRLLGGGALIDGGFHGVYRLLFLASRPVAEVFAVTSRFHTELGWEGEDTALLMLRFEDGLLGEVLISYAFDPPTTGVDRLFTIVGREGVLSGNESELQLRIRTWDLPSSQKLTAAQGHAAWLETFKLQITHFLDVLDGRVAAVQTVEDARRALQVVRAAYDSSDSGAFVHLEGPSHADGLMAN